MTSLTRHHSGSFPGRAVVGAIVFVAAIALFVVAPVSPARGTGGTQLWEARHGAAHYDAAVDLGVDPDGSLVFVTGFMYTPGINGSIVTVAYDPATGAEAWVATYGGPGDDVPSALAVSPDGSAVYVTGYTNTSGSQYDYATIAYDPATGSQLWVATYDGPGSAFDDANDVAVSMDGTRVYVTGVSQNASGDQDYATIAYDAATGGQIWAARYDGPAGDWDRPLAVAVSPDGSIAYVTGFITLKGSRPGMFTIGYGTTAGDVLWSSRHAGTAHEASSGNALAVSPDGATVYVAGYAAGVGTGWDLALLAYDGTTGAQNWVRKFNGRANGDDFAASVAVSPDGQHVYVSGSAYLRNDALVTIAYDAAGSKLWRETYSGTPRGLNATGGMVVSPDGTWVYVAGTSRQRGTAYDYTTLAYDAATGATGWLVHYVGPVRYDNVHAIGVSPDGSAVFVTGQSEGVGTDFDYETVAYTTS